MGQVTDSSNDQNVNNQNSNWQEENDSKNKKNDDEEIPNEMSMASKIAFGFAAAPYQMFYSALSVFGAVFFLEIAKIPPTSNSVILFTSRMMDASTDIIYGYFINKTAPRPYGKFKTWMTASFPLVVASYIALWYTPDFSPNGRFAWYLIFNSLLFTFMSGIRIPYISMMRYLTSSKKERELVTALRMIFEMLGLLFTLSVQGPLVGTGSNDCTGCDANVTNMTISAAAGMTTDLFENVTTTISATTDMTTDLFENVNTKIDNVLTTPATPGFWDAFMVIWENNKYILIASFLSIFFILGMLGLVFLVNERFDLYQSSDEDDEKKINVGKELKQIFQFKPFLILILSFNLNLIGLQVTQSNLQLYFEIGYTAIRELFTFALVGQLVFSIIFIPMWGWVISKIGKRKSFMLATPFVFPLLIGIIFFGSGTTIEIAVFFVCIILSANALSASFLCPWGMLPECIDAYYLKYGTKPDALFNTIFGIGPKLTVAAYLGAFQLMLAEAGYETGACSECQPESVRNVVVYVTSLLPLAAFILSIAAIFFFPISEEMAKKNSEAILAQQQQGQQSKVEKRVPIKSLDIDVKYEDGNVRISSI